MSEQLAISATQLTKKFGNQLAVKNINLSIKNNITTGLIGPNGAGKTTLMSLICGFLKPSSGRVTVLGHEPDDIQLKGRFSILPQDARLLKSLSIKKQLSMLAELQGFDGKQAKNEALKVLEDVGLLEAQNKTPEQLSHGMLKRCAIAQAILGSPELILFDEPTAGLDPTTTDAIKAVIKRLQNKATIIISSHNLAVIEDLCQEVVILNKGELHAHQTIDTIVVQQEALTIKLTEHPTDGQVKKLSEKPWVKRIKVGQPGSCLLVLYYDPSDTNGIEIEALTLLKSVNLVYKEFTKGERLQEYMTDQFK